jgi:hypothetical protein
MKKTKNAEMSDGMPNTNIGNGCQYIDNWATNGADMPKTREIVEHTPMAWLRRFVGYSSAVITQISSKAAPEAHLPIKKNTKINIVFWNRENRIKV